MKKWFLLLVAMLTVCGAAAQQADKLLGIYKAVEEGKESKIEFVKRANGSYRGQIIWLKEPNNANGTPKLDEKNPDEMKRKVRADRVVVVDDVVYDAKKKVWNNGRVYDPTKGKTYKVELSFQDEHTLRVKGSLMGFSKSVYWEKIK